MDQATTLASQPAPPAQLAQRAGVLRRLPLSAWLGLAVCVVLLFLAVAPGILAPYDPTENFVGPTAAAPSGAHLLGTDQFGRDVLSRVIWAARVSVTVGLASAALALLFGVTLGATAVTAKRPFGDALMRLTDVVVAFPALIFAIVMATVLRPGIATTVLVLSILYTPAVARVVRANILVQYAEDYVTAAKLIGASTGHILRRHVAINVFAPVAVFSVVIIADAMLVEAMLSFISISVQPPTPSWGNIMSDGRALINSGGWWVTTFGGLAIFSAVLALNLVSDGISDALGTPRPRGGRSKRRRRVRSRVRTMHRRGDAGAARVGATLDDDDDGDDGALLQIRDLSVRFPARYGDQAVLSGVSFDVHADSATGLVGESGSGKSLIALTIMGLLPRSASVSGRILFRGRDLLSMPPKERRKMLGPELAMVYQDALTSLNPSMTVAAQLRQVCRRGSRYTPSQALELVGLDPDAQLRSYPHQLSGGQRQRVLIAMALAREPALLIADEPTTALDETVQAQIMVLLKRLREEIGMAMLLISHDLALITESAEDAVVLYAGEVAETGPVADLVRAPRHPYTRGLLGSITSLEAREPVLATIPGSVPSPDDLPVGCRFVGRCPNEREDCSVRPPLTVDGTRAVACHHPFSSDPLPTGVHAHD